MGKVANSMLTVAAILFALQITAGAWQHEDKVLLKQVDVLTLHHGRMTTGRRSSPVPQLKCTGGSAAHSYVPQVVQCYNRGSDGVDVQWECKADMDNAYRFGSVGVVCEGYDHPDDPYILKGSCGLEYTLEFTKEGYEQQNRQQNQQHNSYGDQQSSYYGASKQKGNWFGDTITLVIVGVIIYALYRTCIAGQDTGDRQDGTRPPPPPYTPRQNPSAPPPPGFRDEYMPGNDDADCHSTRSNTYSSARPTNATGGGGFWTGAATGGLLGYLFSSRTNTGYGHNTYHQPHNRGWGSGWGSSGWGGGSGLGGGSGWGGGGGWGSSGSRSSFGGGGGGSTGTRTASGFGGTSRR